MEIFNPKNRLELAELICKDFNKKPDGTYYSNVNIIRDMKNYLWSATQFTDEGKDLKWRLRHWSVDAIALYKAQKNQPKDLRHEHVYPQNLLVKQFFAERDTLTIDRVLYLLNRYMHAICITKFEDKEKLGKALKSKMPEGVIDDGTDEYLYSRYAVAKMNIKKVHFEKTNIIVDGDFIVDGKLV